MKHKAAAVLGALGAVAVAMVTAVPAFAAGNAGSTQVATFDATGATFPCSTGVTYTVLGGSVRSIFHDSIDAAGGEHVTGTISPTGVTLSDGTTSTVYRLAKVAAIEHMSSGGSNFSFNFGQCQAPSD